MLIASKGFALEIVYPKKNPVTINAPSTFFIGSVAKGESLKINDAEIKVHENGGFAQIVPLHAGKNNFVLKSGNDIVSFTIEKPQAAAKETKEPVLTEYPPMDDFYVKKPDAPLRMTPVDGGINRMSHLPKGMPLAINGEKNGFYRVYLNSTTSGWIVKTDVEQREKTSHITPIKIKKLKIKADREFCTYEFFLQQPVPFSVKEEDGLVVELFNVSWQCDNTYTFKIPVEKFFGYRVFWDNDKFIVKVRKPPLIDPQKPLENIIVAVDAGHGGGELGAIGCYGDKEKDINLDIAKNLKSELEKRGAKVVMTRDEDISLDLKKRVECAADKNAMILVSIHSNAIPDGADPSKNRGTSVFYYHNQAKPLAEAILDKMTTQLKTQNDRVRQASLALVRPTSSVSVLVEVAYMINPDDCALLLDKKFRKNCAKAIADGIESYLLK